MGSSAPLGLSAAGHDEPEDWPNVWSGGQVLAFSGLDGPTHWSYAVTARTLDDHLGLAFDTDPAVGVVVRVLLDDRLYDRLPGGEGACYRAFRTVRFGNDGVRAELALDDDARTLEVTFLFESEDVFRGLLTVRNEGTAPCRAMVLLEISGQCPETGTVRAVTETPVSFRGDERIVRVSGDDVPALIRGAGQGAREVPRAGLYQAEFTVGGGAAETCQFLLAFPSLFERATPDLLTADQLAAAFPKLPPAPDAEALPPLVRRARAKAIAILRANTFAAEGNFPRSWLVTQRLKHRNFNAFHASFLALGALAIDTNLAVDVLRSALAQQQPNGRIPEQSWPFGFTEETAPPLLCWAHWQVYGVTRDRAWLEDAVARLKDYVKYPLAARLLEKLGHARSKGAKFLTWGRGEGSNMENSPRFEYSEPFAAADFTSYVVSEIAYVARILEELSPENREAVHLGWMGEELAREVQEYFWDEERQFFVDRYPDDDPVDALTIAGLIPLFAGVATPDQAAALVEEHVRSSDGFWTPFPLASLARTDRRFDQNMWRGATWPGMNLLLIHGLRRYGYQDLAAELRERTIEQISYWYQRTGSLWEFYDSLAERPPAELPRGRRTGALADYGWTAAAFLALCSETELG